jgi:hypothetical protein
MWKAINRDIAGSRKLRQELSPAELTSLGSIHPVSEQQPQVSSINGQDREENRSTDRMSQVLIKIWMLFLVSGIDYMLFCLVLWLEWLMQVLFGMHWYDILIIGLVLASV